jgi:hypothetical protein
MIAVDVTHRAPPRCDRGTRWQILGLSRGVVLSGVSSLQRTPECSDG